MIWSLMTLSDRTHWIFDMDGTLTVAAHDFDAIRAELGLRPKIPILEQLDEMTEAEAAPLRVRLEEIEMEIATRSEAQVGAAELLSALRSRGFTVGVLTRNTRHGAMETLYACRLADYFDVDNILGRESCAPKPSADGILQLLGRWRATPSQAVMVGDYLFDLVAGQEAGVATVYFDPTGRFEWGSRADVSVSTLDELRRLAAGE
jgi:HAD superfamily hydrolase (TIGR01509 family)